MVSTACCQLISLLEGVHDRPTAPSARKLPATAASGWLPAATAPAGWLSSATAAGQLPATAAGWLSTATASGRLSATAASGRLPAALSEWLSPWWLPAAARWVSAAAQAGGYPPAGHYGPGGGRPYSVGEAFSWAWNKFSKNAVPLIVATLVYALVVLALQAIINFATAAVSPADTTYTSDENGFSFSYNVTGVAGVLVTFIGWIVSFVVGAAIQSGYIGGMLDIANGHQVTTGSFFRPRNIGNVVIAGLIVGVITTIGFILCIVPGLIASIMLMFTIVALLDRNLSPVDAVKSSFDISKANFGNAFLAWLVMIAIIIVGALLCGVGLLVAYPVATLFLVYTYRALTGGQVAPATP